MWDFEAERLAIVEENLNPLQRLEPLGLGHYGHFLMIPNFGLPSSSLYVGVMRYLRAYGFLGKDLNSSPAGIYVHYPTGVGQAVAVPADLAVDGKGSVSV